MTKLQHSSLIFDMLRTKRISETEQCETPELKPSY